ncbi:MAG: hypothetical protein CMF23_01945 [Ignavibacteriae bacterium]|nr:hypothetical protein [Ignavibacteriota bacterium]
MLTFLAWILLAMICFPLALLTLILYPIVWLLLIPFKIIGFTVDSVLELVKALFYLPSRLVKKM